MLQANDYFEGKVRSIAFDNTDGKATVGAMEIGDYEFGTTTIEKMTILSGSLMVQLPGEIHWKTVNKGQTFTVQAHQKFQLQVKEQTAYVCFYL
jgi:purine/pyrimidine-nucleoside phosphorylase